MKPVLRACVRLAGVAPVLVLALGMARAPERAKAAAADAAPLLVSAAASLRPALTECAAAWTAERGTGVSFNFGGSGALAAQIVNGAPVDVFIAAGEKPMAVVVAAGLADEAGVRRFLGNKLVLIAPRDSATPTDWAGLGERSTRHIGLGEPASVPVGAYAEEVLRKLDLWRATAGRRVYAKDARQVLAYVERGEVSAGVVYATDAAGSDRVRVVAEAPEGSHAPITYPTAVPRAAPRRADALAFAAWLEGAKARDIFRRFGFVVPEATAAP